MRAFIGFLVVLLIVPLSLAAMQVSTDEQAYNIDDEISLNVTFQQDTSFKGFLKLELQCSNSSFPFYLTPLTIEQGVQQSMSTRLPATESMAGECTVQVSLNNANGNTVEQQQSQKLLITTLLAGNLRLEKEIYKAGESVLITGDVLKASGKPFTGTLDIYFGNKLLSNIPVSGRVDYELHIAENELGGKHFIYAKISGINRLEKEFPIFIESEIKTILIDIKELSYNPGETMKALLSLRDQAGLAVPGIISIDIIAPNNNWLGSWKKDSNEVFEYLLEQRAVPGNYTLSATYDKLHTETSFRVKEMKQLGFDVKDNIITITNTGNVNYNDIVELYLESPDKKYLFSKEIQLEPGASAAVELFKEVPDNNYNVTIKPAGEFPLIGMVAVEDTRTLGQKSSDTINEVTGAVVGGGAVSYIAFLFVLIIFIAAGFFVYHQSTMPRKSEQEKRKEQRREEIKDMLDSLHKR